MSTKRHKPEEIVSKLRQVEVLVVQGMARIDAIWQVSASPNRRITVGISSMAGWKPTN